MFLRSVETPKDPAPCWARRSSRSLTARLAGLFALLVLCVLSLSTFVPYRLLTRQLAWEDGKALNQKADAVRQALLEYSTRPDRLEAEVRQEVGSPGFRLYYVRVLEPSGRTLLASEGMASMLPPDVFPSAAADGGRAVRLRKLTPRGRSFLTETRRVRAGKPRPGLWWLQVAVDVTPEQALLGRYRVITLAVFIVALLLSAGGAVAVARWGLRPVARITDMAERIGPHHLSERLGQVEWPAELAELASVFDGMLDRLQDSFERLSRFSADLAHELRTSALKSDDRNGGHPRPCPAGRTLRERTRFGAGRVRPALSPHGESALPGKSRERSRWASRTTHIHTLLTHDSTSRAIPF